MIDDADLLRRYAEHQDESAFTDLVERHLSLVFNCAVRLSGHNTAMAQDATQMAFSDLARQAGKLTRHSSVVAWLHTATRFAVSNLARAERRRQIHELAAATQASLTDSTDVPVDWMRLQPLLDEVIGKLKERERTAILLRFFEGKSLQEISAALQLTESAARSCIDRSLEKMRLQLVRRGIVSTTAGIAVALETQPIVAAPSAWALSLSTTSLVNATAASATKIIVMKKIIIATASVVFAAECATATLQFQRQKELTTHYTNLQQIAQTTVAPSDVASSSASPDAHHPLIPTADSVRDRSEVERLQSRLAQLKARPPGVTDADMKLAQNLGRKTAPDAAQTLLALMASRDLTSLAKYVVFDDDTPENRAAFMAHFSSAVRSRYPTPELVIAAINFDEHLRNPPTAVDVLDFTSYASGITVVKSWVRYASGQEEPSNLPFQEGPGGWTLTAVTLTGKNSRVDWLASRLNPVTGEVLPPRKTP